MTTNTCERNALGTRVPGSDRAAGRPGTIDRFALGEAAIILLEDSCVLALNGTTASTAGVHLMITHGTGLIQVAVDTSRLNRLAIPPMIADVDARAHSAHVAVDAAAGIGTGISAADRARTIRLLADPQSKMEDFTRPGHILPVGTTPKIAQASDVAETVSRLSALAGSQPAVAAYCDVVSLGKPTALADPAEGKQMSEKLGIRRRNGLTRQDKTAPKFPDLLGRDFTAQCPDQRWVGDITEIPTAAGKLYLATVIDLYSRRLLGAATSRHPDAALACAAIEMAVATRGGMQAIWRDDDAQKLIFHTDRGSTYTARRFTRLCQKMGIRQSMGRVGSCFDNAAAEAFFSSLEWEVLSRNEFHTIMEAQAVVLEWCYGFYNHQRRHSAIGMMSPVDYENTAVTEPEAA